MINDSDTEVVRLTENIQTAGVKTYIALNLLAMIDGSKIK